MVELKIKGRFSKYFSFSTNDAIKLISLNDAIKPCLSILLPIHAFNCLFYSILFGSYASAGPRKWCDKLNVEINCSLQTHSNEIVLWLLQLFPLYNWNIPTCALEFFMSLIWVFFPFYFRRVVKFVAFYRCKFY